MTQITNDAVAVLTEDHRAVERIFQELERRETGAEQTRELTDHVITELVRHTVAEEQYLYPTARRVLEDGDAIADQEISEHAEAEQTMKDLEGVEPTDDRFYELLGKLMTEIRNHIEGEEAELFPRLRQSCDEAELVEMGEKIMQAKESAPTRPHPSAPDQPPMNKILDPGAALVDRMRDALSGRGS